MSVVTLFLVDFFNMGFFIPDGVVNRVQLHILIID